MSRLLLVGSLPLLLLAGCQLTKGRVIPSPLTYSEQEQEILKLVPLGTEREAVVRKLEESGIEGTFGTSRSIYYCDLWNRENGDRWHLNVALLFDRSGKLYKTQVAQAETGLLSTAETPDRENSPTKQTPSVTVGTSSGELKVGREALTPRR